MNFLAPMGLLFALFIPMVILLYLLKLKRYDYTVPSTLLWRKSLEDLKANTPFQKLKKNLLLFLQLLIIALLTLAVARPVLELGGLRGQSFIVIIDQSASMSATDLSPSRLEAAKKKAIDLVNDMSMGDKMMVIAFSQNAQSLCPFESSKGVLRNIIRSIRPTDQRTNIEEAMRIAQTAAKNSFNPELILFTDGQFTIPSDVDTGGMKIRYLPVGTSNDNVGIVDFVVRKDFALQQNYQIMVGVRNFSNEDKELYVELWGEGPVRVQFEADVEVNEVTDTPPDNYERNLMDARKLKLAAQTSDTLIFDELGTFPEHIEVVIDSEDDFPLDNKAMAIIPEEESLQILLVTQGNKYLERVLNLDPRVRLFVTTPDQLTALDRYDVVVFDSFTPPNLAEGNYIFINTVPPLPGWSQGETIEYPALIDWDRFHLLTRHLNLENLVISECLSIGTPNWVEVIAESRETPLLVAFQQEKIRALITSFDLYKSNWPMRVSFPIFFSNLLNWFISDEGPGSLIKRTGDILALEEPSDFEGQVNIIPPTPLAEKEINFAENSTVYHSETSKIGIYQYVAGDKIIKKYAFNLLSPEESSLLPKSTLQFENNEVQGDTTAIASNQEIWRLLAIIGILILFFEWYVYVKRARYAF